jgi:hypothetical protein
MKREDIILGKTYRIRAWEDMEKEFGLFEENIDVSGNISFTEEMKQFCGKEFTPEAWDFVGDFAPLIDGFAFNHHMLEEL